ncbi:MAG: TIGR03960 family B12-binding radical SAM protein [Deltaproteobacteria bacterium]|nr:TIGR03960 family B12-binding radical SAM protein [Deltaproteobacteria bacterium]
MTIPTPAVSELGSTAHPYAAFVAEVERPARYLGGEHGSVAKPWGSVEARVCLAFPDVYEIGMSHLGLRILYAILQEHPRCLAERCYAPWPDLEARLREHRVPLVSLESARPLRDFDVVGFSLQFELNYTNVLAMLDLGGIPLRSADRGDDDPLVLAGGPVATHPEPIAPFLDAIVIGDGEEKCVEVALAWSTLRRSGMPRRERLIAIAKLGGVYVPSLYATRIDDANGLEVVDRPLHPGVPARVDRALVRDLSRFPLPTKGPVASAEAVFDRVSLEIARGCTEGCRFCQAGMIYRPVRERDPDEIVSAITAAIRHGGYDEAALTSLSTADYSCIGPLVKRVSERLAGEKVSLAVSSLRAYGLGEDVLDDISRERATGLTFAPEAGTQRMRDVVNKNVTEAQLLETAGRVFSRGWSKMKLYFMIGLPTEEDEDVVGIVQTGERALAVAREVAPRANARVTVSVSTHVPKPHTPFQWCAMDSLSEVERKQALLRATAASDAPVERREVFLDRADQAAPARGSDDRGRKPGGRKARVDLRLHDPGGSVLEGVFARGDRRLAAVLEHAYREGARFDSWDEHLDLDRWRRAFDACGVDPSLYLGTLPVTSRLPWDHLDVGLEDGFLASEHRRALASRLSPPCGKVAGMFVQHQSLREAEPDHRKLVCYDCGVACDLTQMREERLVYLRKLDAREPVAPRPRPARGPKDTTKRTPPKREDQGAFRRVRLAYRKVGRSAFVSHLDLVRILPRIFRRAGIRLRYSDGFHPLPELTFGPALSLGISGLRELLDVKMLGDGPIGDDLVASLSQVSPDGLEMLAAVALGPEDASVSRIVELGRYVVALPFSTLAALGLGVDDGAAPEAWVAAIAARVADARRRELRVRREIDGVGRSIDVGSYLMDVRVGAGRAALDEAGIVGRFVPIEMDLRITGQGSTRPSEVVEALFGEPERSPLTTTLSPRGQREVDPESAVISNGSRGPALAPSAVRRPVAKHAPRFPMAVVRTGLFVLGDGEPVDALDLASVRAARDATRAHAHPGDAHDRPTAEVARDRPTAEITSTAEVVP